MALSSVYQAIAVCAIFHINWSLAHSYREFF